MSGISQILELNQAQAVKYSRELSESNREMSNKTLNSIEERTSVANTNINNHIREVSNAPRNGQTLPRIDIYA